MGRTSEGRFYRWKGRDILHGGLKIRALTHSHTIQCPVALKAQFLCTCIHHSHVYEWYTNEFDMADYTLTESVDNVMYSVPFCAEYSFLYHYYPYSGLLTTYRVDNRGCVTTMKVCKKTFLCWADKHFSTNDCRVLRMDGRFVIMSKKEQKLGIFTNEGKQINEWNIENRKVEDICTYNKSLFVLCSENGYVQKVLIYYHEGSLQTEIGFSGWESSQRPSCIHVVDKKIYVSSFRYLFRIKFEWKDEM